MTTRCPLRCCIASAGLVLAFLTACQDAPERDTPPAKVPVRSEVLASAVFQPSLILLGRIEPSERLEIRTTTSGKVRYAARFAGGLRTGEGVRAGELLFRLENPDLRLRLTEAELAARAAEAEIERNRQGVEGGFVSRADLKRAEIEDELARERLESTRDELARLRWTAPRSGRLWVERKIAPGSEVDAGTVFAEIAGDGAPRVEAWAASADLERLDLGLAVECWSTAGHLAGRGEVVEIARRIGENGTAQVAIAITEDLHMPPPGEGVEARVLLAERDALSVPEEALLLSGGAASVYVLETAGDEYKARRRLVQPGSRSHGRVEVVSGVTEGERIAIGGADLLSDGLLAVESKADG